MNITQEKIASENFSFDAKVVSSLLSGNVVQIKEEVKNYRPNYLHLHY